jgi:hypothetical protein
MVIFERFATLIYVSFLTLLFVIRYRKKVLRSKIILGGKRFFIFGFQNNYLNSGALLILAKLYLINEFFIA